MASAWKTVRVFISSTFRDMQAERDHLVRFVFPRLQEQLLPRRIHLVGVDLRWGVTSEQDASEVCREVINECRPRFLCMLGGRYGTIPEGRGLSITADEVHFGVLDAHGEQMYGLFYFRHGAVTEKMDTSSPGFIREPRHSEKAAKLARLKHEIRRAKCKPFLYRPRWNADEQRLLDLKAFGDRVARDILATIDDEFGTEPPAQLDEFAQENAAMEAFVEERSERFVLGSRGAVLEELRAHTTATGGNGYVCLTGAPGSGKSALLAHLSQHASLAPRPSSLVISHFVGASPGSTDIRRTLRRFCHELKAGCPDITADIPDDPEKLRDALPDFLRQACAKKRVVILLDAVNQFDPASHSAGLHWLPEELPPNARVILSALDGPTLDELRRRPCKPREIEFEPLTAADGEAIIEQFRKRYHKQFESDQRTALLAKTDAGTPLYLLAALEELRTLGTYEEITRRIAELPPTASELFAWILERLENDDGFRDAAGRRVGRELVSRFAALLGASRYGLSQHELADLLGAGDPQGNVAAFLHLLRPYLMRRGELLDFYHGQFRQAVAKEYLRSKAEYRAAHSALADYFRIQADPGKDRTWNSSVARPFLQLPWHLHDADRDAELRLLLFDFRWLQAKLEATDVVELVGDFEHMIEDKELRLVQEAIRLSSHAIGPDKNQLAAQLSGRMSDCEEPEIKQLTKAARAWRGTLWLMPINTCLREPGTPLIRTVTLHRSPLQGVAVASDGRLVLSGAGDDRNPTELKLWDLKTGQELHNLVGHIGSITCVAITVDRKFAVSGSRDRTIRIWDVNNGREIGQLSGHQDRVTGVSLTADGRLAVSCSWDHTIRIWDLETAECCRTIATHSEFLEHLSLTPDGRRVLAVANGSSLRLWDLATGTSLCTMDGQYTAFDTLAITPDGLKAICAAYRGPIKVLDLVTGRILRTINNKREEVQAVVVCPNGRSFISGAGDGTLAVWDIETGQLLGEFEGHTSWVHGIAMTPDGETAVSAGADRTLRVWNVKEGQQPKKVTKHEKKVIAVAVESDGCRAFSVSQDRTLNSWDIDTGKILRTVKGKGWAVIYAADVTMDGKKVVSTLFGPEVDLWDGNTGETLLSCSNPNDSTFSLAICADGTKAVFGDARGSAWIWDLEHRGIFSLRRSLRKLKIPLDGDLIPYVRVAISPNGRFVLAGHSYEFRLWDLEKTRSLKTFRRSRNSGMLWALALSTDARWAVSGDLSGALEVWDLERGQVLHTIATHSGQINGAALSANARWAAGVTGSLLQVWNVTNKEMCARFVADAGLLCCTLGPDGRIVVAGDESGRVHFLRLVLPEDPVA